MYLAEQFEQLGLKTVYPGLKSHPSHEIFKTMMNETYGFGGMLTIDVGSLDKANEHGIDATQKFRLLAVSLGFTRPYLVSLEPQHPLKFLKTNKKYGIIRRTYSFFYWIR